MAKWVSSAFVWRPSVSMTWYLWNSTVRAEIARRAAVLDDVDEVEIGSEEARQPFRHEAVVVGEEDARPAGLVYQAIIPGRRRTPGGPTSSCARVRRPSPGSRSPGDRWRRRWRGRSGSPRPPPRWPPGARPRDAGPPPARRERRGAAGRDGQDAGRRAVDRRGERLARDVDDDPEAERGVLLHRPLDPERHAVAEGPFVQRGGPRPVEPEERRADREEVADLGHELDDAAGPDREEEDAESEDDQAEERGGCSRWERGRVKISRTAVRGTDGVSSFGGPPAGNRRGARAPRRRARRRPSGRCTCSRTRP